MRSAWLLVLLWVGGRGATSVKGRLNRKRRQLPPPPPPLPPPQDLLLLLLLVLLAARVLAVCLTTPWRLSHLRHTNLRDWSERRSGSVSATSHHHRPLTREGARSSKDNHQRTQKGRRGSATATFYTTHRHGSLSNRTGRVAVRARAVLTTITTTTASSNNNNQ